MAENQILGKQSKSHFIEMTERKTLRVSGVDDVISFDEGCIVLSTICGILSVDGSDLRIVSLDVDRGNVDISGCINAMIYPESMKKSGGLFRRKHK